MAFRKTRARRCPDSEPVRNVGPDVDVHRENSQRNCRIGIRVSGAAARALLDVGFFGLTSPPFTKRTPNRFEDAHTTLTAPRIGERVDKLKNLGEPFPVLDEQQRSGGRNVGDTAGQNLAVAEFDARGPTYILSLFSPHGRTMERLHLTVSYYRPD